MLFSALTFPLIDPNQLVGPMLDATWRRFVERLGATFLAIFLAAIAGGLFGTPAGWVVLIAEVVIIHKGDRRRMLNRVRDKIGDQFRRIFIEDGPELQRKIERNFEQQFAKASVNLQATLDREIATVQGGLDSAVEIQRGGQAAIDEEKVRLETIKTLLTAQFEELSRAIYGRVLTSEEQNALVERFTFLKDEDDA